MSSKQVTVNFGGVNLLTILFVALKLTHYIDWSWWWVLAPTWLPFGVLLGFLVAMGIVVGVGALVAALKG